VASASGFDARFSFSCRGSEMSGFGASFAAGMPAKYLSIQAPTCFESKSPTTTSTALFGA
jgi:hypothetical protein